MEAEPFTDADGTPDTRYCHRERCRCPRCDSVKLKTTRSLQDDDDCKSQRKRCLACGHTFIDVQE